MDASYFFLANRTNSVSFTDPGTGVLARPFTNGAGQLRISTGC